MNYRSASAHSILDRFARRLTVEGVDAPAGGGSTPPAAAEPPAAGGAAPAAGAAPDAPKEPTSLLSDAPPAGDAPVVAEEPKVETPEEKAERLKNETPEQKTERETAEATAKAEAMKPYDALKLPEGMPADQPAFVDFKAKALDLGVEPEKAQALIDTVAPKMKDALEAPYNLWADTQVAWVNEVKADPVIGGANLEKSIAVAARAIDSYSTPEEGLAVRKALAFTGGGNNPEIVRWMHRVGLKLGEGTPTQSKPATTKTLTAADYYPTMNPNPS